MRIAHVSATFPPYQAGTGNVCWHNARELVRRGHEVHVFTAAMPEAAAHELRDGVVIHRLRPLLQLGNASILPGLCWSLRGFDIIHVHCPCILGAEMTVLAAALTRTPLVVTYHNDLIRTGTWRDIVFGLATWSLRHVVLYHADRLLFVSQGHAETNEQRSMYDKRRAHSRILPNGVDIYTFRPEGQATDVRKALGLPADAPVIGFVAGLDRAHHYKGLEILLTALCTPMLAATHLLVVGDGELLDGYRRQAGDLGLSARVLFYGGVPQEALPPLLRACDTVAIPSLVPESFSLTLIESLACGIPVVASDGWGVRSVLTDGEDGLLVRPGDAADLAEKLVMLQNDAARRMQMGACGRAKVEACYSWEHSGTRLEAVYHELLGTAPRPRLYLSP